MLGGNLGSLLYGDVSVVGILTYQHCCFPVQLALLVSSLTAWSMPWIVLASAAAAVVAVAAVAADFQH